MLCVTESGVGSGLTRATVFGDLDTISFADGKIRQIQASAPSHRVTRSCFNDRTKTYLSYLTHQSVNSAKFELQSNYISERIYSGD